MLEYNCRLGDPETQAILLRSNFDLAQACLLAATGSLAGFEAKWLPGASACVVLASEGYPAQPTVGREISGLSATVRIRYVVFHAGTRRAGIRSIPPEAVSWPSLETGPIWTKLCAVIYERIASIHIDGAFYRHDIGAAARKAHAVAPA